jgi:hypothetical protein
MINIGDTILWAGQVYNIIDIDPNIPNNQILFKWGYIEMWHSDLETVNDLINEGVIIVVKRANDISPVKYINKFYL